jgi:ABC-type phosphate/phosphonate transport system substrate-binding protein
MKQLFRIFSMLVACIFAPGYARAESAWQSEWEKTLGAAKKEGKVVVGIPPSAELRKELESGFKAKFGFELEVFPASSG